MTDSSLIDRLTPVDEKSGWLSPRRTSLAAFALALVLITASVSLSLVAQRVVESQEDRILIERTADIQALIESLFNDFSSSMEAIGAAVFTQTDRTTTFRETARPHFNPAGGFSYIALVEHRGGSPTVTASVGSGPPVGTELIGPQGEAVERARTGRGQLVTARLFNAESDRRLVLAMRPTAAPGSEVLYAEIDVRPFNPEVATGATAYRGVGVAVYSGFSTEPENLVMATTPNVPLDPPVLERIMHIGGDTYILLTNAQGRLGGSLAHSLPVIVLLSGLATAALVTAVVRVIQRRREYAMTLVEERTNALSESMKVLRQRAEIDAVLRSVSQDVASASDVNAAVTALFRALREIVPVDRVILASLEGNELKVRASAGPGPLKPGQTLPARMPVVRNILQSRAITVLAPGDVGDDPDMRSDVAMPVSGATAVPALMIASTAEDDAYKPEQLPFLESLARETNAVFNQLLALEREREAARRFQELDHLKSEFVGIVAHDLRSPMTVIAGFADLLRSNADHLTDEERREYLERISTNVKNLSGLVEDVLQVARIESGEMTVERHVFDLGRMIHRTAFEMTHAQSGRECLMDIPPELPMVEADEQRQWQIFVNLLSNAFKFSPPDKPVEVRLRESGDHLEVAITDHGIGIRPEDVPRLFQKFSRVAQPGDRNVGGTGLGLYIARSLVEAQGGTIAVDTAVGKGSTFRYTVPLAKVRA